VIIGIDGNEANIKNRVGSNTYAFNVLCGLEKNKVINQQYEIFLRDQPLSDMPKERNGWKYNVFGPKRLWTQFALPLNLFLNKKKPDVFYSPGHYAPRFSQIPSIITILDTSYLLFPKLFRLRDLIQLKSWSSYGIKNAKKIIAISNSTKNDIIKYYRVKENKIEIIYPGYDKDRYYYDLDSSIVQKTLDKYKIKKPYILFVGTIQPRKNLSGLIEAFNILNKSIKDINLVIAGKTGWLYKDIISKIHQNKEGNILLTGFVDNNDLPYLYKGALCYVLPSLYEGFGIPVLEAMAVGCPVIVSNNSSLPEIVEDGGILINPEKKESITDGLYNIINMDNKTKESLINKGLTRVKKFSWENCLERIQNVIKEVCYENNN